MAAEVAKDEVFPPSNAVSWMLSPDSIRPVDSALVRPSRLCRVIRIDTVA